MAGQVKTLLILFSLLSLTEEFEVKDDEWEELSPDIAALHRLKGLSEHITYQSLQDPPDLRRTSRHGTRVGRSTRRVHNDQQIMSLLDGVMEECEDLTTCVIQKHQEFEIFLGHIDEQKIGDRLLTAAEIAHSYKMKFLVMTDEERLTKERVQREYIRDPHYSVKVSKACLHNDSCLPEADRHTVVKVFGSVSEDGQTVSGHSGSELAELMLRPSLRAALVFSLDGNTTADFQLDFLQGFMHRGFKVVLEMSQEDHQVYQVMGKTDVVSTTSPKTAVDHTTQYDHQQILIMENDDVVRKAATYLYEKHPAVSSVYELDEHQNPKLNYGNSVPLSENSRLVLVGHGRETDTGEIKLAGYKAEDVARIIGRTSRVGNQIKTTSVVGCKVGSDKAFITTLLKELHVTAGINTELHLRDTVLQVTHTGKKITLEITPTGMEWRNKDDSKKVVATLDRSGDVVIRKQSGNKGEAIFTNERNFLMDTNTPGNIENSSPTGPHRFITPEVFNTFEPNEGESIKKFSNQLEALTWMIFHQERSPPQKVDTNNIEQIIEHFVIGEKKTMKQGNEEKETIEWIDDEDTLRKVLSDCYEINTGQDILNVIDHYGKTRENKDTYLMLNDWIFLVDASLYVYPVGRRLQDYERNMRSIQEARSCITDHLGKHSYNIIRGQIFTDNARKQTFAEYVQATFQGYSSKTFSKEKSWFNTYIAASIISESARNFRTFPLVLMALDLIQYTKNNVPDNSIRQQGWNFFENPPMARGGTWIDSSKRGFEGASAPQGTGGLTNLKELIESEISFFKSWRYANQKLKLRHIFDIAELNEVSIGDYGELNGKMKQLLSKVDNERPSTSGTLGGSDDGYVTSRDLTSASEVENTVKLTSYFSRTSESISEQIHRQLKETYGEKLAGLHVQEGSARIENRQFICQFVSDNVNAHREFRVALASEGRQYNEKMLKTIEAAAHKLETQGSLSPHQVNEHAERAGTAVGALGLMLGMRGAVRAFEHGDIEDGVTASLQTLHGVTGMTLAAVAKQAVSSETRIGKAALSVMRNPATKATMSIMPVVGIEFGLYIIKQDLERGDALGYFDAGLDTGLLALDTVEIAQPELAPVIVPLQVATLVIRMVVDDVYMGIQHEFMSLQQDAGVLDKIGAVFVGLGKAIRHVGIELASFFYNWRYDEIEEGHRLVEQISDYHKYYRVTKTRYGTKAIDFTHGDSSWNGGGISFYLADQGNSKFCMNYSVSNDERPEYNCSDIDTQGSKDIILGLGESHRLEYKELQKKVLMFIPAGSVKVVSGYKALSYSRYGTYKGNRESNRFFAVQNTKNNHTIEIMLTYYYRLYGEPGDDIFFLGPQKSYVEGSAGKDTFIIPDNGGKTIINNYDPSKILDTLHFGVEYSQISVSKSGNDVVFSYKENHTVIVQNWFVGEVYRHMNMMSGDGVLFEVSSTVISSVQLVARGINKMSEKHGVTVDASQPLLRTVTTIFGSPYFDKLIGNGENNLMDGGGGRDRLIGKEGEDIYVVNGRENSWAEIENFSRDNKTDLAIIEASSSEFLRPSVANDHLVLLGLCPGKKICGVTLVNWFRSEADRHLLIVTKDLITFTISDNKTDCMVQDNPFTNCLRSHSIDYTNSQSPLEVDLQKDKILHSVTEVRGSKFNDVIKGNKEHNVIVPGGGHDFLQGRGGEDWYVVTPGQGVKTINNLSPDLVKDTLFLKERYQYVTCSCEGQHVILSVNGTREVVLQGWFDSRRSQHLQIQTSDGITFELMSSINSCAGSLKLPLTIDLRKYRARALDSLQTQQPTWPFHSDKTRVPLTQGGCFKYKSRNSKEKPFCGYHGHVMMASDTDSVIQMYGSSGFDIMIGNGKNNLLDPYTGGALMHGGKGKDTYTIKQGYGDKIMIDNFAEDQIVDTLLVDMDFLSGDQIKTEWDEENLNVTITTKGEQLNISLLNYNYNPKYQHLNFKTTDGVHFNLTVQKTNRDVPLIRTEAFKVTLKQTQVDCRLDLGDHRNLSKVQTVQGCPSQSNHILGNDQDNALFGGWKDDALEGGEGKDTLIGGNGNDILVGGLGDDALYGEDGNDTMMGNSGWDVFIPGPGADLVDGGPGRDTVLYRGDHKKGEGVYVNLLSGKCYRADAEGDELKDVEIVIGTIYSDLLVSGYEAALLKGSDGNDTLVSTGGDYLIGGDGNDIYVLAFQQGSVTIDNCAEDKATDVLYLRRGFPKLSDCQNVLNGVKLIFSSVNVTLHGWVNDEDDCGHLMLVYEEEKWSEGRLSEKCTSKPR